MSKFFTTALLGCGILAVSATAARAADTHVLDKITIKGNVQVSTESLRAVLQEKTGTKVSTADILADQDALSAVYTKANVAGRVSTSLVSMSDGHIQVVFTFAEEAPAAPVAATVVAPKLHQESFAGNKCMTSDELAVASGLKPGDDLTDAKITATQKILADYYKSNANGTKKDCGSNNVSIAGETSKNGDGSYDVVWTINEVKVKEKKKKKSDDEGGMAVDQ